MENYGTGTVFKEIYNRKIGILGLGQMGGALLVAFSKFLSNQAKELMNSNTSHDVFYLYDPQVSKQDEYMSFGFKNMEKNEPDIFKKSKVIFLCVKPDTVGDLLINNMDHITPDTLLVSICAGISISYIESLFKKYKVAVPKVIRIMANHLCLINESGSVYSTNSKCNFSDEEVITTLLKNVGIIKKVNESKMNVYTAYAGSGPAFVYKFAESLVDAGLKNGIDVNTAREYAIQIIYGAAKYMKHSPEKSPSNIKYIVTTPNGTTIHGLNQLDKYSFKYALTQAVTFATKRGMDIEQEKMKSLTKPKF